MELLPKFRNSTFRNPELFDTISVLCIQQDVPIIRCVTINIEVSVHEVIKSLFKEEVHHTKKISVE